MNPTQYVSALCSYTLDNVFNPYAHRCPIHDLDDAPNRRRDAILAMLGVAYRSEVDAIWVGRDLGYRGGRRTGLALTDDVHFPMHTTRWGLNLERPTTGSIVAERTAAVVWSILAEVNAPVFLWNVFPYHPHEPSNSFSNRSHNAKERQIGEDLLSELVRLLRPKRMVAIGNDASRSVERIFGTHQTITVRHPSYGGIRTFLCQMRSLYRLSGQERQALLV